MGYLLQMSDEIHDWLADLHRSDPPTAMSVAQALAALMSDGASLGPPLVIPAADFSSPENLKGRSTPPIRTCWSMNAMRRHVAEAATLRRDLEQQIAELQSARHGGEVKPIAASRAAAAAHQRDRGRGAADRPSQREQARIDAFRIRKEVLKAAYTAARADTLIDEHMEDPGQVGAEASARLRDVTAEIERELGRQAPAGACWTCARARPVTAASASCSPSSRPAPRC